MQQIVPSPFSIKNMNTESPSAILNTGEPELPSGAAASGPTSSIICLKPAPAAGNTLPNIDAGNALVADNSLVAPRELVTGLLHRGTKGVLAASSKVGKSWMLLDLATSIATGTRFLKWNTTAGRVLFLNFEIHRAFIKKRLQIIQERKQLTNLDNLDIWTLRGASANPEELLERIIDETRADHYALIILDPIYKLMVGRSENMAGGVGALSHDHQSRPSGLRTDPRAALEDINNACRTARPGAVVSTTTGVHKTPDRNQ